MAAKNTVGKYEILERIGRGGFATVYRALDTQMGREVALKIIHGSSTDEHTFVERFRREAHIAASLRHPNIVPIYDFGDIDGRLYLAMALVDQGRTLRELLAEQGSISLDRTLSILTPLAGALDYLHLQDPPLIHRDVKPANVLLEEKEDTLWVALTDFGLVRSFAASSSITGESILGTPNYMAPEQADPRQWGEITPLADVYSLGVVSYEMLTGHTPFEGEAVSILHAHAYEPPPSPLTFIPDLSQDLADVLARALAKSPAERYQSAGVLIAALRQVAETRSEAVEQEATLEQLEARARELLEAGEWLEALDSCARMVRLDPDRPAVLEMLTAAKDGLDRQRTDAASRRQLEEQYAEGLKLLEENEWKQAIVTFEEVIAGNPDFRDAQKKLVQARSERLYAEWYDEAIAHGEAGRWKEASRRWIDLLRERPGYRDGEAVSRLLTAADALLDYQKVARDSSEQQSRNVKRIRDALTLYDDLAAAMDAKDWENAVQLAKSLSKLAFSELESDLDHLRVWLARAQSELQRQAIPWIVHLEKTSIGQPLVVGDSLLVPTQDSDPSVQRSVLCALNLADGSIRWQKTFEYARINGLVVNVDALALVATSSTDLIHGEGALLALDEEGKECWRWSPGVQRVSAPALAENKVWITADAAALVVIDSITGAELARSELVASPSLSAPAVESNVAYVPCRGPHLLAAGPDGRLYWRYDAKDPSTPWLDETPVVFGDFLFTVLSTGAVLAIRVDDGSLAWQTNVSPESTPLSPPVTDGERLFVGANDGLHALALADGREVWTVPTERRIVAAPIVTSGVVYTVCHDHHLYALDAITGQELWHYQVERRIETPPSVTTCGEPAIPCVVIADRGGTLTAIARPLSAAEHEAAGNWHEAVSAYAALGQLARGAGLLEAQGELLEAAELWLEAEKHERAAELYEAAGAWQRAAELWFALERPFRQAGALEGYARSLDDTTCSAEERAAAWTVAAEAFDAEGEVERAASCRREIARCLHQPIITLNIQHQGLVLDAWSQLGFTMHNEGYGVARNLIVRATGDQFESQVMATRQIAKLRAGGKRAEKINIRPLQHGSSVPLHLIIEYTNRAGEACVCEQTLYIPVARHESDRGEGQVLHVSTAGGAVIFGDVGVEGGSFVGRDASVSEGKPN